MSPEFALCGLLVGLMALFEVQRWLRWERQWPGWRQRRSALLWVTRWTSSDRCWHTYEVRDHPALPVLLDKHVVRGGLPDELAVLSFRRVRYHLCYARIEYARTDTPGLFLLWMGRCLEEWCLDRWYATLATVMRVLWAQGYRWPEGEALSWRMFWKGLQAGPGR